MSNAIIDVSSYWDPRGKIDTSQAFVDSGGAINYILRCLRGLPAKCAVFKTEARKICQFIQEGHFSEVGTKIKLQDSKCEIVAALPDGTYLILAERLSVRRDRVHVRIGAKAVPGARPKPIKDITDYWRKDNTLRRDRSFIDEGDAIAYIRRAASLIRDTAKAADSAILLSIENMCIAVEHNFFRLIGRNVRTNERSPEASRGPLPTTGKITAVLPEGKGLALSNKAPNGIRYGFLVGRKRMAQISRDSKKKRK